jgi:hypothetical protein
MKGHFYKTRCNCKLSCKCGSPWGFRVNVGKDPQTGKRRQTSKGGFKTKKEAEAACNMLLLEVEQHR